VVVVEGATLARLSRLIDGRLGVSRGGKAFGELEPERGRPRGRR
jgi:hypothetical protein